MLKFANVSLENCKESAKIILTVSYLKNYIQSQFILYYFPVVVNFMSDVGIVHFYDVWMTLKFEQTDILVSMPNFRPLDFFLRESLPFIKWIRIFVTAFNSVDGAVVWIFEDCAHNHILSSHLICFQILDAFRTGRLNCEEELILIFGYFYHN